MLEKIEHVPHYTSRMDQCMSELKDVNDAYVMKPTRFVTSSPVLASTLSVRCDGNHDHVQVQGRGQKDGHNISSLLGRWTPQLGVMILDGIQRQVMLEEQCGEVKYYLDEADVYHLRPRGGAKASAPEWESGGQRGRKKHGALFGGRGEESFICGSLPGSSCERRKRRETERRETERRERERGERDERDEKEMREMREMRERETERQ